MVWFQRFRASAYTNTISARYYKDGSEVLIDQSDFGKIRRTPRECARLQGFPEDFDLSVVSDVQNYRQFGNSLIGASYRCNRKINRSRNPVACYLPSLRFHLIIEEVSRSSEFKMPLPDLGLIIDDARNSLAAIDPNQIILLMILLGII